MGSKRRCRKQLRVQIKYAAAPSGDERLSRAIDILLKAATRDTSQSKKEEPPCQAPAGDAPTGGAEENDSHESR